MRLLPVYYSTLLAVAPLGPSVVIGDNDHNTIFREANAVVPLTLTANKRHAPVPRFLRVVDDDEDERAFGIPSMSTITETAMKIPGASTVAGVAKNLPGASIVGDLAQKLQYQYWLKMNKTPDEVKTILGLDNLGAKILDHPNLDIWIRYTRMYNERKDLPDTSMISELLKKIPTDRMMELVKKIPGSAKTIENVQQQYWLRMQKTPAEVKTVLGLDDLGGKILDSPNLDIWIRYARVYNERNNLPETAMIEDLLKMVPADRMLELSKKLPGSAKTIENVQYKLWLHMNKTPDEVKTLLGLDNLGTKLLDSPNLNIWIRFKRMYNQQHGIANAA